MFWVENRNLVHQLQHIDLCQQSITFLFTWPLHQKVKHCVSFTAAKSIVHNECRPTSPGSAVLVVRSNQYHRPAFPVMGNWLSPLANKGGKDTQNALVHHTAASKLAMGNVQTPKKIKRISPYIPSKKSSHSLASMQDGSKFWPLKDLWRGKKNKKCFITLEHVETQPLELKAAH